MVVSEEWFEPFEVHGITASIVASFISLISVSSLLCILTWMSLTGRGRTRKPFLKTHVGAYFLSLMLADLAQTAGGIMGLRWVLERRIFSGAFCTAQATVKLFSDVSAAIWSAVIAIHTFRLLLFSASTTNRQCYITLAVTWLSIIIIVVVGPIVLQTTHGDFFGVTGHWCWITSKYMVARFFLQWFFMFSSAIISVVTYTMMFFRLRGNLVSEGRRLRFLRVPSSEAWNLEAGPAVMEVNLMKIAWQLMWYPLSYTLSILPLACVRWSSFTGHNVPFPVEMFAYVVFMLSGFTNTIVFITTRRIFPPIRFRRKPPSTSALNINVRMSRIQHISPAWTTGVLSPRSSRSEPSSSDEGENCRTPLMAREGKGRPSVESAGTSFGDVKVE